MRTQAEKTISRVYTTSSLLSRTKPLSRDPLIEAPQQLTPTTTLLVIHSPQLGKHFTHEMDRLWDTEELGITPHSQRKLERQKIGCGDGAVRR